MKAALGLAAIVLMAAPALAQERPDPGDLAAIRKCITSKPDKQETCIGLLSYPCLDDPKKVQSTADMVACSTRERVVWDDILNDAYRRLRKALDEQQQEKLRDMQRAWVVSRDKTCAFFWDFFQGTMASPMTAQCVSKETAQRALFLLNFLDDTKGK